MACSSSPGSQDPLNNSGVSTGLSTAASMEGCSKSEVFSDLLRAYFGDKGGNLEVQDFLKIWKHVDPAGYDEEIIPSLRTTLNSDGTIEMEKLIKWIWGDTNGASPAVEVASPRSPASPVPSNRSRRASATPQSWETVFKELDKDGDGYVTQAEMYDAILGWLQMSPDPESPCFATLHRCFPTAVPCHFVCTRLVESLRREDIIPSNTICATSICPDEINFSPSGMAYLLSNYWGASYSMGGLAGVPFTGRSGYRAILRHMPQDGNVVIFFGPHIAISEGGDLTKLTRRGQTKEGRSCGALWYAFECLRKGFLNTNTEDLSDIQMHWLRQQLTKMQLPPEEENNPDVQSILVYQLYELIKDMMLDVTNREAPQIKEAFLEAPNLVLIGGIQINLPQPFDDHFAPLMYKIIRKDGKEASYLEEVKPPVSCQRASETGIFHLFSWLHWSPAPGTPCFKALHEHFPGVIPSEMIVRLSCNSLRSRGFTDDNTLFGQSCCPDEINTEKGGMLSRMVEEWGECFPLSGISGAPFTGKTGFGAFSGHVPEDGHVLICFAPHIAISINGELGKVKRLGQTDYSAACGAVLAAYNSCKQPDCSYAYEELDMQQSWLRQEIGRRMDRIQNAPEPLAALIHETYQAIKENMSQIVNHKFGSGKLVLLGGIQINMPHTFADHFQPLMFTMYHADGTEEDLMPELALSKPLAALERKGTKELPIGHTMTWKC